MSSKREELKEVASREVMRTGIGKLSFRRLADMVGVKSSSVHHYFPEKSSLAVEILADYREAFIGELAEIDEKHTDPKKRLMAFVDMFERVADKQSFCLCGMLATEVSLLNDDAREQLSTFFADCESWLESLLKTHSSQLTVDMSPALLSKVILSALEGALLIDLVDSKKRRSKAQRDFVRKLLK